MKSFTQLRNLYGSLTNNTASTNLTLGDELINDALRNIYSAHDWDFLYTSATASTVASQQFYNLPFDYDKLISVKVTVGSCIYVPRECPDRMTWDRLNISTNVTSDTPEYYYIYNGQLGFWPKPSSATTDAITFLYRKRAADLSMADYSTGNIDIITNGATSVTGAGSPAWTSPMAGRWLRVAPTNVAATSGDGMWYQISSITSSTVLVLARAYNGTSLTTGAAAAYTMGQMSLLPEDYHDLPVYRAAYIYYTSVQPESQRWPIFKTMYDEGLARLWRDHGSKTLNVTISDGEDHYIMNPNLAPQSIGT